MRRFLKHFHEWLDSLLDMHLDFTGDLMTPDWSDDPVHKEQEMTQIMIEVSQDTITHLHKMTALHPKLSIAQLAGQLLEAQIRYRLEMDRMRASVEEASPFGAGLSR